MLEPTVMDVTGCYWARGISRMVRRADGVVIPLGADLNGADVH